MAARKSQSKVALPNVRGGKLWKAIRGLQVADGASAPKANPPSPPASPGKVVGKVAVKKRKVGKKSKSKRRRKSRTQRRGQTRTIKTECFADIEFEEINYLWEPFIPIGMLVLMQGDPKAGKSFITCFIAAMETTKGSWPGTNGAKGEGGGILFLTRENNAKKTIKPRLKAMGADMHRIHRPEKGEIVTLGDVEPLRQVIRRHKVRIVIVDPITDYLPKGTNINSDVSMRRVLGPLAQLAEDENVAMIIVRHIKKGRGGRATQQGYGSVGITAIARSELLVGNVCGRRTLVQIANNNGPEGTALGFEIGDDGLTFTGLCSMRVEDILNPPKNSDRYIEAFLRATLPSRVTDARQAAKKAGIKTDPLNLVVKKLEILRERVHLKGQGRGKCYYMWRFPDGPGVSQSE